MKIIFLDIDGVLNSNQTADDWRLKTGTNGWGGFFHENEPATVENVKWGPNLVANLKSIVEATKASIVISSTWRKHFSVEKFKEMFRVYGWVDAPVIDKTPSGYRVRGQEIERWLNGKNITSYVILDDYDDMLKSQYPSFVKTNPEVGLDKEDVIRAINILNQDYGTIHKDTISRRTNRS